MMIRNLSLVVFIAAAALAGCGDDDTTTATAAGTVTIGVHDYAFDDVPATIRVGSPITISNTSTKEAHELTAFRLADNEARPLKELRALPPESLGALAPGAPALALYAAPNADGQLILGDGTLQEPGRYLLLCFIPTGAKPDDVLAAMRKAAADPAAGPPQIAGGPPHAAAGMIAEITVVR